MIKLNILVIIEHNDNHVIVTTVHALTSIFFLIFEGIVYVFLTIYELWYPTVAPSTRNQAIKKFQHTIYKEAYCWDSLLTCCLAIIFENTSKTVHAVNTFQDYLTVEKGSSEFTSRTFYTKRIFACLKFVILKLVTVKKFKM